MARDRIGLFGAIGLALVVAFVGGCAFDRQINRGGATAKLEAVGGDMTRAGAATVRVSTDGVYLSQRCNGACDSFILGFPVKNEDYNVAVRNAADACILCTGRYVDVSVDVDDRIAGEADLRLVGRDIFKRNAAVARR